MLKLTKRYYKILLLKCTTIFKEQTRLPLKPTIEKNWQRQKRNKFEQLLQILVHVDMKSTKKDQFQQKALKSNRFWSSQFWNPIANPSVKVEHQITST